MRTDGEPWVIRAGLSSTQPPSRKAREWFTLTAFAYAVDNLGNRIPALRS